MKKRKEVKKENGRRRCAGFLLLITEPALSRRPVHTKKVEGTLSGLSAGDILLPIHICRVTGT